MSSDSEWLDTSQSAIQETLIFSDSVSANTQYSLMMIDMKPSYVVMVGSVCSEQFTILGVTMRITGVGI